MEEYELEHTGCARQEAVLVHGGNRLCGELTVQGAKNSTLPLLAAALLCEGETVLHNCPALSDVHTAVTILRRLGCRCTHTGDTLTVCADGMTRCDIPHSLMREMRSSIVFLGAILSRCGEARLSFPGGCELGPRPIDLHLEALRKLGAEIREEHGCLLCTAPGGLRGGCTAQRKTLPGPRVRLGARRQDCRRRVQTETFALAARPARLACVPAHSLMREMRSSIVFLGAILSRCGEARLSFPGGCELGPRPIDLHLEALRKLGAEIREEHGCLLCTAPGGLRGGFVSLAFPSVGATENLLLAAARAKGTTVLTNAAREPEIEDLAGYLNRCGAHIHGAGESCIVIEGVPHLYGSTYTVMPDRIAAATYMAAAAVTGGTVLLRDVNSEHLLPVLSAFESTGCAVMQSGSELLLRAPQRLKPVRHVRTMPYPGFPTDAQAPVMTMAAVGDGTSIFVENIFESRYKHAGELNRLGAKIKLEGKVAVIEGVPQLSGAPVSAEDLRGGAALVIAGLAAQGETQVMHPQYIDRGYAHFEENLRALGADVYRI